MRLRRKRVFLPADIQRRLTADEHGPGRRCGYCGRRIWPFVRVGLAFDNYSPAHLRCVSRGRMPLFLEPLRGWRKRRELRRLWREDTALVVLQTIADRLEPPSGQDAA
jgi:hypothetical protein